MGYLSLSFLLVSTSPGIARGQPAPPGETGMAEARLHYERGMQALKEGAYELALVEMQRANAAAPSYRILYNIGLIDVHLQDYAGAVKAFESYLKEGGAEIPSARQDEVKQQLTALAPRVATIEITTSVPGVEILIDEVPAGKTPFSQPLLINAGKRRISGVKPGSTTITRVVTAAGGEALALKLDVEPVPGTSGAGTPSTSAMPTSTAEAPPATSASSTVAPSSTAIPPRSRSTSNHAWIAWTGTGVLTAAATVTGVLALRARNDLRDEKDTLGTTRADLAHTDHTRATFAALSDVFLASAVVAGGFALYLSLHTSPPAGNDSRTSSTLSLGLDGLSYRSSF